MHYAAFYGQKLNFVVPNIYWYWYQLILVHCTVAKKYSGIKRLLAVCLQSFCPCADCLQAINADDNNLDDIGVFDAVGQQHDCEHVQFLVLLLGQEDDDVLHDVGITQNNPVLSCRTDTQMTASAASSVKKVGEGGSRKLQFSDRQLQIFDRGHYRWSKVQFWP